MKSVEASAKTRKEAIQNALDDLGAELHEVDIEIMDEGSKGLFGFGARDVRVKVSAEHLQDEAPRRSERKGRGDRRPRDRKDGESRGQQRGKGSEQEKRGSRGDQKRGGRGGNDKKASGEGRGRGGREGGGREGGGREQSRDGKSGSDRNRNQDGNRNRNRNQDRNQDRDRDRDRGPRREQSKSAEERPRRSESPPRAEGTDEARRPRRRDPNRVIDRDKAALTGKTAAALLQEMIEKMSMEAQVTSTLNEEGHIILAVESPDSAILIGRKGRNLNAMQFLINRMVLSPDDEDDADRIIIDVEGYLDRRKTNLEDLALRMAERAKEIGKTVRINKPLSPQERRIIHVALESDDEVETHSLGSSLHRRVVIVPEGGDINDVEDSEPSRDRGPRRGGRSNDRGSRDDRPPRRDYSESNEDDNEARDDYSDTRDDDNDIRDDDNAPRDDDNGSSDNHDESDENSGASRDDEPVTADVDADPEPVAVEQAVERAPAPKPVAAKPAAPKSAAPKPVVTPSARGAAPYKIDVAAIREQAARERNE